MIPHPTRLVPTRLTALSQRVRESKWGTEAGRSPASVPHKSIYPLRCNPVLLGASLGASLAIALSACSPSSQPQSPAASSQPQSPAASSTRASTQTLTVGTEPAFPPFEFQSADGKDLQGFNIDLVRALAQAMGKDVQFESLPFDGLIPALRAGKLDMVSSSLTITAERAKVVAFSRPYFKAGLAIATQATNNSITSLDSLKGKKIAVQIGTTGAQTAAKVSGAQISTFDSAPLALQELANSRVDAVINDAPVTQYAIKEGKLNTLKIVGSLITEEYYGLAFPQGSATPDGVNKALSTLIENGTYGKIYRKWFNSEPPVLPQTYQPQG